MTLRCHACGRAVKRYAASNTGADGTVYGWGPVCAREVVVRAKRQVRAEVVWRRGKTRVPARDPRQADWITEATA
jgi:hypothetical protein